jgi:hypothetical protein
MKLMRRITAAVVLVVLAGTLFVGNLWLWVFGGGLFLGALWAWYLHDDPGSKRSQGLAAALSALALLFAVYWYMIERPGAAKLDLELAGKAFDAGGGRALVFLSVELRNVGNTPVSFEGIEEDEDAAAPAAAAGPEPAPPPAEEDCLAQSGGGAAGAAAQGVMMVRLGKALPLSPGLERRLACATPGADGAAAGLARADVWPPLARVDQSLVTRIEAGESERYYYRALVRCEEGLVVSASARIPKRGTITDALVQREPVGQVWIGQSLIDLTEACAK